MTHDEIIALIRAGVPTQAATWADFGAGSGNFTLALAELLDPQATLYAIDRDAGALHRLQSRLPGVRTITGDFTQPLDLLELDGMIMANALHFIWRQEKTLRQVAGYLRPGGCFLIVEYDVTTPRGYIPHPVPYERFELLADTIGLRDVARIGVRRSPSSGITMYAAMGIC